MKPYIGISCSYDYRDTLGITMNAGHYGQAWTFLAADYVEAIERADGIPVLIPQFRNFDNARALLDQLDGVLLSGGHDVGAERYGAFPTHCGAVIPQRDQQDISIAEYIIHHRQIPLLGICRGIQVMNVAYGGTIIQDLEKEAGLSNHMGVNYPRNYGWHTNHIERGTKLAQIYGKTDLSVNSFHHQAIKQLGNDLIVTAKSEDGVIEAIESPGERYIVGVQWHPEMMHDSDEQALLFLSFVNACKKGAILK